MIFKGEEKKFAINLTSPGFSMDTCDFDIEIVSTIGGSLKGSKGGTGTDVIIFKDGDAWYGIVNTANELRPGGSLKVIATAYVPDAHANDGIRTEIAVAILDKFVEP